MQLFHVIGGTGFTVGMMAHFFLVLIVGIAQMMLMASPDPVAMGAVPVVVHEVGMAVMAHETSDVDLFDKWTLSIFVLISALVLVGISFVARWSWPIVSEKALCVAFLWFLYGIIMSNFGICVCCSNGSGAPLCSGAWYEHISSSLWILATLAAFLVDAWSIELRQVSLMVTISLSVILSLAPSSMCNAFPAPSWLIFLRVTLFHLLWHSNRLQRVAESTAYGVYIRCTNALDNVRVIRTGDPEILPVDVPASLVGTWRVLTTIARDMTRVQEVIQHQGDTLFALHGEKQGNRNVFGIANTITSTSRHFGGTDDSGRSHSQYPHQQEPQPLTPSQTFLMAVHESRRGLPHLSDFADCADDAAATVYDDGGDNERLHTRTPRMHNSSWIDWKYRHYSHSLMLAIDTMRSSWVLGVCPIYLPLVTFEIAWLWYNIYHTCSEIISTTRPIEHIGPCHAK
jgi:hypothetical protein